MTTIVPGLMPKKPQQIKSYCNSCVAETNHKILHLHNASGTYEIVDYGEFEWSTKYYLLKCAGCDAVSMREDNWDELHEQESTKYLPARIFRKKPEWIGTQEFSLVCPNDVLPLLHETYVALQSNCVHSTAMCIRAIIENLMTSTVGDKGSFSKNLGAFEAAGYISAKQRPIIEGVLEVGHATIHRQHRPKREQLVMLIDILETLLQLLYVHPEQLKDLRKTTPKRARP